MIVLESVKGFFMVSCVIPPRWCEYDVYVVKSPQAGGACVDVVVYGQIVGVKDFER